jgi:hypothetical protein
VVWEDVMVFLFLALLPPLVQAVLVVDYGLDVVIAVWFYSFNIHLSNLLALLYMSSAYGYGVGRQPLRLRCNMPPAVFEQVLMHVVVLAATLTYAPIVVVTAGAVTSFLAVIFGWYSYYAKETFYEDERVLRQQMEDAGLTDEQKHTRLRYLRYVGRLRPLPHSSKSEDQD